MQKIKLNKFIRWYKQLAIILLNTFLLFLLINLVLAAGFWTKNKIVKPKIGPYIYGDEVLHKIYSNLTDDERYELLKESWSINLVYEPYVQYKEEATEGRFVNVDSNGFRHIEDQCQFPIQKDKLNIFVFGGSTTFGYGVSDWETIPSRLQARLRQLNCSSVCVYNFGRGSYFSLQERILFENLLLDNQTPNIAIFIDGLNDFVAFTTAFRGEPAYTLQLKKLMNMSRDGSIEWSKLIDKLPLIRVANYFTGRHDIELPELNKDMTPVVLRWFNNKKMIGTISMDYNVSTFFVIQPVPVYKYNLTYHSIAKGNMKIILGKYPRSLGVYPLFYEYYKNSASEKEDILWLADIQLNKTKNLYVDTAHYTAEFSDEIASHISRRLALFCRKTN